MSMEAVIPDATSGDKIQYILYTISEFIKEELPFYRDQKEFEKEMEDHTMTHPKPTNGSSPWLPNTRTIEVSN